jgi:hypothetical protein
MKYKTQAIIESAAFAILIVIIIFLFAVILSSCSTASKCDKAQRKYELAAYKYGCPWKITDSVTITKTVTITKDTTVYVTIAGDTVRDTIRLSVPGINTPHSLIRTRYAISDAWIENSLLRHTLEQVKQDIQFVLKDVIRASAAVKVTTTKVPYPVEVKVEKQLSKLQRFGLWSGVIAWLLTILYVLYRFRKAITFRGWFG